MSTLFPVLTIGSSIILCYTVYLILDRRKQSKTANVQTAESMLDDTSYIQEMKHLSGKDGNVVWQQYDILLAAQHYGWETMVDYAAYLESADFDNVESLTVADISDEPATDLTYVYNQSKVGLKNFEKLAVERGLLGVGGHSRTLNDSIKIVWFNQTRTLRVFTRINDETLVTKYVETVIRRTFGTKDAMKLAKFHAMCFMLFVFI